MHNPLLLNSQLNPALRKLLSNCLSVRGATLKYGRGTSVSDAVVVVVVVSILNLLRRVMRRNYNYSKLILNLHTFLLHRREYSSR